jgi:hypothetical protein
VIAVRRSASVRPGKKSFVRVAPSSLPTTGHLAELATDPDRAERIAYSITNEAPKLPALVAIAETLASTSSA